MIMYVRRIQAFESVRDDFLEFYKNDLHENFAKNATFLRKFPCISGA